MRSLFRPGRRAGPLSAAILGIACITGTAMAGEYDPSAEHPYGRPHPEAADGLADFAFAIGSWSCLSHRPQPDGSMKETHLDWRFEYGLNGRSVHDYFEDEWIRGFGVRLYYPATKTWNVTTSGVWPNVFSAVWNGGKKDGILVLDQPNKGPNGEDLISRLSFYAVTDRSFEWKMERINGADSTLRWHIVCERTG